MLAKVGLDAQASAAAVAQALLEAVNDVHRLGALVAVELEASEVDKRREAETSLRHRHNAELLAVQQQLDDALRHRRLLEERVRTAEEFTTSAEADARQAAVGRLAHERAHAAAEGAREQAETRAREAEADAAAERLRADALARAAAQSEAAAEIAEQARARAEEAAARATSDLKDQQLRTAEVLAEQERRASLAQAAAVEKVERRAARERNRAVREVREALSLQVQALREELGAARTQPAIG